MSLDATRWAWKIQNLRPLHKLILLALADRANSDDEVWPSYDQLTADTGVDRKTTWQAIKSMKESGLLIDTGGRKGRTGQVQILRLIGVSRRSDEVKQFQKGNDSENGTVPFLPSNSSENGMRNSSENGIRNLPIEPTKETTNKNAHAQMRTDKLKSFDRVWSIWPNKVDKKRAQEAWMKLSPSADLVETIVSAIEAAKGTAQWLRGVIPHFSTYINNRRWEDEISTATSYTPEEIEVFSEYNQVLNSAGWPEAVVTPYMADRAEAIRKFLRFSNKPGWVSNYFAWMAGNLEAREGFGFDWVLSEKTYTRAREGNFAVLREAA